MRRDPRLFLKDIIGAMDAIEEFVEGMELEDFVEDDKTSSAVIRKFEMIGEAVKNLPEGCKQEYPQIPWRNMAGFRDRLIHGYFGIDTELVWDTVTVEIPRIRPSLQNILVELEGSS